MSERLKNLGKKIQAHSKELADQLSKIPREEYTYSINSSSEVFPSMQEKLFLLLGRYLEKRNDEVKRDLHSFADYYSQKSASRLTSLDQILRFVYLSRLVLLEFLEKEWQNGNTDAAAVFEAMKVIEPVCLSLSNRMIHHFSDNLSSAKYALDETNEDLRITLQELSNLKDALNEAAIFSVLDAGGRFLYVNDKFCEASLYTETELFKRTYRDLLSPQHLDAFSLSLQESDLIGKVWKGELLNQAKDGRQYWLDTTIVPIFDHNSSNYQYIMIQFDTTEKKRAEEMLQKTEKLSMVGELAAGIAHEIRNPLTAIKGFVQLLGETERDHIFAETILEEIDRINAIVSEFMIFAKPHSIVFNECSLIHLLQGVIAFMEPEAILRNVHLSFQHPDKDLVILGERNQLKQVFLNLVKNAIEAMPHGGSIKISIEKNPKQAVISISDTGTGLTPEQIKKLGEPFFTTKTTGNGLGLMVSYKIIESHYGSISVNSLPGEGTTFIITLPLVPEPEAESDC